jgi:hypothetical protein
MLGCLANIGMLMSKRRSEKPDKHRLDRRVHQDILSPDGLLIIFCFHFDLHGRMPCKCYHVAKCGHTATGSYVLSTYSCLKTYMSCVLAVGSGCPLVYPSTVFLRSVCPGRGLFRYSTTSDLGVPVNTVPTHGYPIRMAFNLHRAA